MRKSKKAATPQIHLNSEQECIVFEMATAGPSAVKNASSGPSQSGRLLLNKGKIASKSARRHIKKGETLTLGGIACLARAAMSRQGQKLQLANFSTSLRRALATSPERARLLLSRLFAGNVRGRLAAAAWAGAVSKTATAPLETVRMQMMTGKKGTFREVVRDTWVNGGVLGFFSGNEADVLRTMPSKAIELASFDMYKRLLGRDAQGAGMAGLATSVAGGLAGITSTVAMFPLETARTRLACNSKQYKNLIDCLTTITRTEGFSALYKGLNASLIGVIPYAAVRLGMYDGLKWGHKRMTGSSEIPAQNSMLYGALAAVTSATVSFPLEVVRRRMMMGTATGNTMAAISMIARQEGIGALYKGVLLTWVKQAPQYAVTFCCYDLAKSWLASEGKNTTVKA